MVDHNLLAQAREQVLNEKIVIMNVSGDSMEPLIKNSAKVVVKKMSKIEELQRFDVVVFGQEDRLICHYFWKVNKHFSSSIDNPVIITRPLNPMIGYDHPISFNEIVGKVSNFKISRILKIRIYIKTALNRYLEND